MDLILPLSFIMLIITIICYQLSDKDIIAPLFLLPFSFTCSSFLVIPYSELWDLHIGIKSFLFIIASIVAYCFGCKTVINSYSDDSSPKIGFREIQIDNNFVISVSIFLSFLLYQSFNELLQLSIELGNTSGYSQMIHTVRYKIEDNSIIMPRSMEYRLLTAQVICYYFLYIFFNNMFFSSNLRKQLIFLVPVIIYIPFTVLTTGRMHMLFLLIYCVVVMAFFYQNINGKNFKTHIRFLSILSVFILLFLIMFFLMGLLTGKSIIANRSLFMIISHYGGLSIPALDKLLDTSILENGYIGDKTLLGVFGFLRRFITVPEPKVLNFTEFRGIDTNVYTALGRYFYDYGFCMSIAMMFFIGLVYSEGYRRLNTYFDRKKLMVFAAYSYPLICFYQDEWFLMSVFTIRFVYFVVLLYFFDFITNNFFKEKSQLND